MGYTVWHFVVDEATGVLKRIPAVRWCALWNGKISMAEWAGRGVRAIELGLDVDHRRVQRGAQAPSVPDDPGRWRATMHHGCQLGLTLARPASGTFARWRRFIPERRREHPTVDTDHFRSTPRPSPEPWLLRPRGDAVPQSPARTAP